MNLLQCFKTSGVACLLLAAAGCSGGASSAGTGSGGSGGSSAGALSLSGLVAVESPSNVLAYNVSWTSSAAADTELDVACNGLTPWTISGPTATTKHQVFLMGLATGVACTLTAKSTAGKETASEQTTIHISALPSFLPPVDLTVAPVTGSVAPGWTLIDISNLHDKIPYTVALVDEQGRYRWYFQYPTTTPGADSPVIPYKDGVVVGGDFLPMSYITWQGDIVWTGPTNGNHEVRPAETPGDFYYITEVPCPPLTNVSSMIGEYRPSDNSTVWTWTLCNHYTPPQDVYDWSHMNTVALFPDHKFLIASSRGQNSIFKINRATGNLVWVMGYHGAVTSGFHGDFAIADADRFYHQHDTTVLPNGHILMFDNGRSGVRDWSRALELAYTYNPGGTSEAHAVWQFRHTPDLFDQIWGSAQRFSNGDTLVCFGSIVPGIPSTLTEVTSADKTVWEVKMPDYWGVYRATRMTPPRGSVIP